MPDGFAGFTAAECARGRYSRHALATIYLLDMLLTCWVCLAAAELMLTTWWAIAGMILSRDAL